MSTDSNAHPPVQPVSSGPSTPLPTPPPSDPPPSDPAASWWGPAFQPRDEGWPLRYVPLPPPPPAPWRWRWSPLIGILYGPIPVGLIIALLILLAAQG